MGQGIPCASESGGNTPGSAPSQADVPALSPGRNRRGRFTRGNAAAVSHGLHARVLPPEVEALLDNVAEFREQSIADDGGPVEMSRRRRSLHDYRAIVHRNIQLLAVALDRGTLFDDRGRLRVTWISKLESLIATARALDNLLGTERNARDVTPKTATAWLDARAKQQENQP